MATKNEPENNRKLDKWQSKCNVFFSHEKPNGNQSVVFNPDFYVERLRHEHPQTFTDLVLSNITRLIDLPGDEFAQLTGESEPRVPSSSGFLRSFNFLKRKEKGVIFGAPLTEEGIAHIYQLIEYLSKNLHVEGLFRVPGHSLRQAALREMLNAGAEMDLETGDFHPNDAASLLKMYLGELPEPLLTHRHYLAHLKIGELTLFDENGDKTNNPDKHRQIEAFQLLFMLLPPANRSLLKLLLDLLYHTARNQHANKMSANNLAKMFAPHIIWPKNVMASDLQENMEKLNNGVTFLIRNSQKLFKNDKKLHSSPFPEQNSEILECVHLRQHLIPKPERTAPVYIKEYARVIYSGSKTLQAKDDLSLCSGTKDGSVAAITAASPSPSIRTIEGETQSYTESALKELYQQVNKMPQSAKKKKLIRQFEKRPELTPVADSPTPFVRRHFRSRSLGGIIKRKAPGYQTFPQKENTQSKAD